MCLKSPKPPKAPTVQPAPKREEPVDERRRLAGQQGVFSNIMTSPLGDSGYGANAQKLATLGAA